LLAPILIAIVRIIGIVAGYNAKLAAKLPFTKARNERWKPHPGQSYPVRYLSGQGIRYLFISPVKTEDTNR
jgi:hypothetical protein